MGLAASRAFGSDGFAESGFGAAAVAGGLFDPQAASTLFVFGGRVVTLWNGTLRTFVRDRVSMVAVTDMPGRNGSFSVTRIFTSKRVASCCWPIPPPRWACSPRPFEELAI